MGIVGRALLVDDAVPILEAATVYQTMNVGTMKVMFLTAKDGGKQIMVEDLNGSYFFITER